LEVIATLSSLGFQSGNALLQLVVIQYKLVNKIHEPLVSLYCYMLLVHTIVSVAMTSPLSLNFIVNLRASWFSMGCASFRTSAGQTACDHFVP
jgi:hypothetical protein